MANETIELTVAYVNDPKPGKKWGSVKSSEGGYFWGPPAMLRKFKVGEVCTITYSLSDDGQFRAIEKKLGPETAGSKPAPLSPPPRPRTNPNDQVHIFVTALLGHFIDAGKVTLDEDMIQEAADMILRAYRKCSLGGMQAQTRDDMDDSIDF